MFLTVFIFKRGEKRFFGIYIDNFSFFYVCVMFDISKLTFNSQFNKYIRNTIL